MSAIWNSYSKSDTARMPRMMMVASISLRKFTSRPVNGRTSTAGLPTYSSRIISARSVALNSAFLPAFSRIPTTTRGKICEARVTMSTCPMWKGSNEPG